MHTSQRRKPRDKRPSALGTVGSSMLHGITSGIHLAEQFSRDFIVNPAGSLLDIARDAGQSNVTSVFVRPKRSVSSEWTTDLVDIMPTHALVSSRHCRPIFDAHHFRPIVASADSLPFLLWITRAPATLMSSRTIALAQHNTTQRTLAPRTHSFPRKHGATNGHGVHRSQQRSRSYRAGECPTATRHS
jgi:hypothetical protein